MPTIFHKQQLEPAWLRFTYVVGYDEGEGGEGEGGAEGGDGEGEEGDGEGDEPDESTPEGLKKALDAERKLRKTAEQKLKIAARKAANQAAKEGESGKKGEGDAGQTGQQGNGETDARIEKLTTALRNNSLRSTISELASNFSDPSDVYRFLDTGAFDYEQDADDPSVVVWDEAEIRAAIKDLAKQKPYLLKAPAGDGAQSQRQRRGSSGPKFAGSGSGKQTGGLSNAEIAQRFPAMRTAVRAGNKSE